MKLNSLLKIKKNRKTIGRGGGRGGTCGKGTKGQKARSGGLKQAQFEGGQTPLTRRLPRRGFNNANFSIKYSIVSLEKLILLSEKTSCYEIDKNFLVEQGCIKNLRQKVKVILKNKATENLLQVKFSLIIDACSGSVEKMINASGSKLVFC